MKIMYIFLPIVIEEKLLFYNIWDKDLLFEYEFKEKFV